VRSNYFTVANAPNRMLSLKSDPWEDFRRAEKPLDGKGKSATRRRR
jgi:bifunctional non-homologous end joining protein LigD